MIDFAELRIAEPVHQHVYLVADDEEARLGDFRPPPYPATLWSHP